MMNADKRSLRVFLCHASGDKPAVRKLYSRLVADGVDAWFDIEKLIPGQDWQIEISKAVRNSDVVIVCLSSQSITKEGFVQKEIRFALDVADEKPDGTIFIIPARLEACDVPTRISKFHWVDLFADDGYKWLKKALVIRADTVGAILSSHSSQARVSSSFVRDSPRTGSSELFGDLLKSLFLNIFIGIGLFSLDKQSKRKWVYPLAILLGYFGYILASGVSSGWQLISLNFILIVWGISFVDIGFTWNRRRNMLN